MKKSASTYRYRSFLLAAFVLLFCISSLSAQEQQDTAVAAQSTQQAAADIDTGHSVKKAMLYSIIPGGGQVYNGKYWKLPLVYGMLGTTVYFTVFNHQQYRIYLDAFYTRIDNDPDNDEFTGVYSEAQLITLQDQYRRWRDLSIILTAAAYGLQMLDAYVDAHLHYFDIDEDLSLRWEPALIPQNYAGGSPAMGVGITLSFK